MQVLPYDAVWRTKIELYMGRLENAVLDAARAGYASRAPTWTMAGALLYSASLTTLVGKMVGPHAKNKIPALVCFRGPCLPYLIHLLRWCLCIL